MNLDELAQREVELYKIVTSLQGTMEEKANQLEEGGVFHAYRQIHQQYTRLHKHDSEALKRGLFLWWYAVVEPACFTGLNELDPNVANKIIHTLDRRLKRGISDYELDWMLGYYGKWEFAFEAFNEFKHFQNKLHSPSVEMPNQIDKVAMAKRGQMGRYWNSLNTFNQTANH